MENNYRTKLLEIGVHADLAGFEYLNYAISTYRPLMPIIKLYEDVAAKYGVTRYAAERNMRHAISKSNDVLPCGQWIAKYKILWGDNNGL